MRKLRGHHREAEINIAPLVDMTFLLLIFFMVSTTFIKELKIDIERPGAKSASRAEQRALRVAIDRRGEMFVDSRPVKPWMIQSRVRELLGRRRSKIVLVITDRRVDAGRLVDVVDQCRLAGAKDVGVAVEGEI